VRVFVLRDTIKRYCRMPACTVTVAARYTQYHAMTLLLCVPCLRRREMKVFFVSAVAAWVDV